MKTTGNENGCIFNVRNSIETRDFYKQFILWDQLAWIESFNFSSTAKGNNNLRLHMAGSQVSFICRGSLNDIMRLLPERFLRINKYQVVNTQYIAGRQGLRSFYLEGAVFRFGEAYSKSNISLFNPGNAHLF